jgi:hypothetical protein
MCRYVSRWIDYERSPDGLDTSRRPLMRIKRWYSSLTGREGLKGLGSAQPIMAWMNRPGKRGQRVDSEMLTSKSNEATRVRCGQVRFEEKRGNRTTYMLSPRKAGVAAIPERGLDFGYLCAFFEMAQRRTWLSRVTLSVRISN